MNGQIIFIIWRESIEALLVIGILHAWLKGNGAAGGAMAHLWGGVAAGLALAAALAWVMLHLPAWLPPAWLDHVMAAMMLLAAALILRMVLWMRAHGRSLRADMEKGLQRAVSESRWWGIFGLAMLAVGREGSETAIFLSGILSARPGWQAWPLLGAMAAGLMAAAATWAMLQASRRHLSWRAFFKASEIMLLMLGCALSVSAMDKLISSGILPLAPVLWDTSGLLDDGGRLGGLVSALSGYRARPDMIIVSTWIAYWSLGSGLIKRDGRCRIQAKSRCLFVPRQYLKVLARAKRLRDEA